MSTLYDAYRDREYAEQLQAEMLRNPDRGLYAEYNNKDVQVTFANGYSATGHFLKEYMRERYTLNLIGCRGIEFQPEDIKSIEYAHID